MPEKGSCSKGCNTGAAALSPRLPVVAALLVLRVALETRRENTAKHKVLELRELTSILQLIFSDLEMRPYCACSPLIMITRTEQNFSP